MCTRFRSLILNFHSLTSWKVFYLISTFLIFSPFLVFQVFSKTDSKSINILEDKIKLDALQCTRMFYSEGSVGCRESDPSGGNVILLKVNSLSDSILTTLSTESGNGNFKKENIGILISSEMLSNTTVHALRNISPKIKAIIVQNTNVPNTISQCISSDGYIPKNNPQCNDMLGLTYTNSSFSTSLNISYSPDVWSPQGLDTPDGVLSFLQPISSSTSATTTSTKVNGEYKWNLYGNGLLLENFDFPIVIINTEDSTTDPSGTSTSSNLDINDLQDIDWVTQERNYCSGKSPIIKGILNYYFGPDNANSISCLKWKNNAGEIMPQCLPLGGQSIWGSSLNQSALMDTTTSSASANKILLTTGIDSNALFHDLAKGANDAVASLVTLLVTGRALALYNFTNIAYPINSWKSSLLFGFFQGEKYGYLGSNRFFTDVANFSCNDHSRVEPESSPDKSGACTSPVRASTAFQSIDIDSIQLAISVDQVGLLQSNTAEEEGQLYLLTSDYDKLVETGVWAAFNSSKLAMPSANSTAIPPSPLNPLLYIAKNKDNKNNHNIPTAFLTGYNESGFIDPAYHSHWNVRSHINTTSIYDASQLLLKAIFIIVTGDQESYNDLSIPLLPDLDLIESLVECLTSDLYCDLVKKYVSDEFSNLINYIGHNIYISPPPSPPSYYTGVITYYRGQTLIENNYKYCGDCPNQGQSFSYTNGDRIYAVPSYIEAFIHAYLSETLGLIQNMDSNDKYSSCSSVADCISGDNSSPNDSGAMYQCINSQCIPVSAAYYHPAMDISILPTSKVGVFDLKDSNDNIIDSTNYDKDTIYTFQTPVWTEPNWNSINTVIYSSITKELEFVILGVSIGIIAVSLYGTILFKRILTENKLL